MKQLPSQQTLSKHRATRAWTLIEMMVVVSVVGLLAALLFPVVGNARNSANTAKCASNLRQLGAAIFAYAQDNNGKLPEAIFDQSRQFDYWRRSLLVYAGLPSPGDPYVWQTPFWTCPEVKKKVVKNGEKRDINSFAMNANLGNLNVHLVKISRPSRKMLATDATLGPNGTLGNPLEHINPTINKYPRDYHHGANNILFVDGHVELWEKASRLNEDPYKTGAEEDIWSP